MNIKFIENPSLSENELYALYDDLNWKKYTSNIQQLVEGVKSSLYVVGAYDEAELIGLIRVVGDGHTIVYIQDVLIKNMFQHQGLGTTLFNMVQHKYSHVRQMVLMSDDVNKNDQFYRKQGFNKGTAFNLVLYVKLND
jgi:ribosomal protein S18 acetylase RimI-like enzyme